MREYLKKYKYLVNLKRFLHTTIVMRPLCLYNPEKAAKLVYKKTFKKQLNLDNPKGFNEKLQWIKLNQMNDLIIKCADKYKMRDYVKTLGYSELLCDLYGVYRNVEEIDFNQLPSKFVLKCTHGCGYNIICSDKEALDIKSTKKQLNQWMNEKYGYATCELHYTEMTPRIICEEFLEDSTYENLIDYKVYCFNGKPLYTLVCLDRGSEVKKVFYDLHWNKVDLRKDNADLDIVKPSCYSEMLKYAEALSQPFSFIRVDFYNVNNKPILGELTFTPAGCLSTEYTEEAEKILGDLIRL